jgi:hypothetical protein
MHPVTHTRACTHTHTYTLTYTHTYIHTHTHARIHVHNLQLTPLQVQPLKQVVSNLQHQPIPQQQVLSSQASQQSSEGREQLVFLPGSSVPVRVMLPPTPIQRKVSLCVGLGEEGAAHNGLLP